MKDGAKAVERLLAKCTVCPRGCGVNRIRGERGYCRAGAEPEVYRYAPHHGEEPCLSGTRGSGTIFFTHCNMMCVYCQNYCFSQLDQGETVSTDELARIMLGLQAAGCHNINLVSPSHYAPQISLAIERARRAGLTLPIVYNTGGYDSVETLRMLEGVVDIYLPDMRYSSGAEALAYSDAADYVERNREAVCEMHRQVGDLVVDEEGIAKRGVIVRLLVLPQEISGTKETLRFIAHEISKRTYLSIMSQYYPTYKACGYKELSRGVTRIEYGDVVDEAASLGFENGWVQEVPSQVDVRFAGTHLKRKGRKDG